MTDKQCQPSAPENEETKRPRIIAVDDLFQGRREVWLEHEGNRYRLRLTRRNKLILQK